MWTEVVSLTALVFGLVFGSLAAVFLLAEVQRWWNMRRREKLGR